VADDTQSANQFFSLSTQIASGHADHFCDSILGSANALLAEDAEQAALDKLESATVICPLNIEIIDAIVLPDRRSATRTQQCQEKYIS